MESAEELYLQLLDEQERTLATEFLRKARQVAEDQWSRAMAGNPSPVNTPTVRTDIVDDSSLVLEPDKLDDATSGTAARGVKTPQLQKTLCKLQDRTRLRALEATLTAVQLGSTREIKDLRHPEASHKWTHHLDS